MPASQRSFAVTEAYRTRLFAIRDRTERFAFQAWLRIEELDTTDWSDRVAAVLASAQAEAVRASAGYLSAYLSSEFGRRTQGPLLSSRDYSGLARDGRPLSESLRSPLIGTLAALKSKEPNDALTYGRNRGVRMVERDLMYAARESLREGMERDERIEGWQRAVSGTCGACAGDIAVEVRVELPSIPLRIHPNCQCVTQPIVMGVRERYSLPTGEQLVERMSRAEQDDQFGPEKAEALRSGDLRLQDLVGTSPLATEPDLITERPLDAALP